MKRQLLLVALPGLLLISCQSASTGSSSTSPASTPTPAQVGTGQRVVLPSPAEVSAPSHTVIWALYPQFNALFRSTDQGATWERRQMPAQMPVSPMGTSIAFVDDMQGWLLSAVSPETQCNAEGSAVWHTSDGGATWQQLQTVGIAPAQCKMNLSFIDPRRGFLTAWDDNHRPTVYRTSDSGVTWTASTVPDPHGFTTLGAGDALQVGLVKRFDPRLLVDASGMQPDGLHRYVLSSTDGGATWTSVATTPAPQESVAFVGGDRWLQLAMRVETTDSGKTWHALNTDYSQAAPIAPQVLFADSTVGYATVRGEIQRTIDGGAHWSAIKSPGT
jgi:photosystem II stability/assembly factor-like uncharacterized protein